MKFALTFEHASKALTTFAHNVFDTVDAAKAELDKVHMLSLEVGSSLGAYFAVTPVKPLEDGTLQAEDGRTVEVQARVALG